MTKNKTLLVFFALVFGFCGSSFADDYIDCEDNKSLCLAYLSSCTQEVSYISGIAANIVYESTLNGGVYAPSIEQDALQVNYKAVNLNSYLGSVRAIVESVDCSSTNSAGICPDLSPVLQMLTNIHFRVTSIGSDVQLIRSQFGNYLSSIDERLAHLSDYQLETFFAVSNFSSLVSEDLSVVTNSLATVISNQLLLNSSFQGFVNSFQGFVTSFDSFVASYLTFRTSVLGYLDSISQYLRIYLPYLQTINSEVSNIHSNLFNGDEWDIGSFFSWRGMEWRNDLLQVTRRSPRDLTFPFNRADVWDEGGANIFGVLIGGFSNLIIAGNSLNNYFYWLREHLLSNSSSNDLSRIEAGLSSLSNIATRIDSYALGDFSNKFNDVWRDIGLLVSNSVYSASISSNLNEIVDGVNTNNLYLSSIDSKLDVLDYIKILSTTPLSSYSGDVDYFDYLTNLYINGSADSGVASTNWFERMEILLASLVFGDSDGTNGIPQSVEMDGVDSSIVETALSDYTYNQEFTGAITALDDTRQSFIAVLNGLHTSIKSVSLPASISIGLGGLDGEDTHNFEDMMHGHFQVSFNTGIADRFTIAVRAVTTISWILLFFLALWKSGFYLIRKLVYFYRLVTRLLVSVFTR